MILQNFGQLAIFKSTIFCLKIKIKHNNQNQEAFIDVIINYKFYRSTNPILFFVFCFFFAVLSSDQKINLVPPKYDLSNKIFDLQSH